MYTLTDLTKTYSGRGSQPVTALNSVSLTIPDGEFVSIQGPTGGGKSTLLQLLGALDRPTSGSLSLGGHNIAEAQEKELTRLRATDIGFVFQNFNLIPTLTASENVQTALVPHGVPRAERETRAREALESVGLADRADHLPSELSGGQQQRVAIARALVARPTVLLADEPTGNLDEHTRDDIMALLESQWKERGLTMIMVTHDSAVAARAQRRLRLAGGTVTDITPAGTRI
ncbi:MAG: ABC transporter ATP-binding protein [Mycetocola sp.]